MVDNFEQIRGLLKFENVDDFYFVQVLQRTKENPGLGKNNNLIRTYLIYSLEYFDKKKEEMIKICQAHNARLYIHLNRRNFQKIGLEFLEDIAHQINAGQYQTLRHSYDSVCGKHHSEKDKTWIIDIDGEDTLPLDEYQSILYDLEPIGVKLIALIMTKNGYHIISKPFNSQKFGEICPNIQVHKNNPTLLFCP